ncbi:FtsQ-type POTRA domain-containing protein [Naasia lichenicola]|uniref:FtsQ-type POTRA domain-containing protein n=1 Tax=Naasia lichenicola TaxID=2565933 RepID=UPI00130DAA94|nr:FtsQ-type POTRA domain-containing protein [Naasia lichenicola]
MLAPDPTSDPAADADADATERLDGPSTDVGALTDREVRASLRAASRARRRVERGEVRRFTHTARRRRAIVLALTGAVTAVLAVVAISTFSPVFALRTVAVEGAARLSATEVEAVLDDQLGTPMPLLDRSTIAADLAGFPIIRSYVLESRLPDTLVVRVVERTPIGAVQTAAGYELVDATGVTVQTTGERPAGFPLIRLESAGSTGTTAVDRTSVGFTAASSVLAALPVELLGQLDSITARTVDDVTLQLNTGQRVVWGSASDSATKAEHLTALLAQHPTTVTEYDVSSPGVGIIR